MSREVPITCAKGFEYSCDEGVEAISCALERARGKNLRKNKTTQTTGPRLAGKSFRATDFVLEIEEGFCGAAVDLLRSARQRKVSLCSKIESGTLGYAQDRSLYRATWPGRNR
jgi:hypothetical protein